MLISIKVAVLFVAGISAQPGKGGGGRGPGVSCPTDGSFTGTPSYMGTDGPKAAPLRGNIGCVDAGPLATRPTAGRNSESAQNIYGPFEAGFNSEIPGMSCLGDVVVQGGLDTNLAEAVVATHCGPNNVEVLDSCGGHAIPYHYHERLNCLYSDDPATGHSTRIGTALDGNGIYGSHVAGGVEPTDLDACGGRFGVTPDSNGKEVYYYPVTSSAPFTLGCFGPVSSVAECRALYPECDGVTVSVTTEHGTGQYDADCPCFDPSTGSNVVGQGRPGFLPLIAAPPTTTAPPVAAPTTGTQPPVAPPDDSQPQRPPSERPVDVAPHSHHRETGAAAHAYLSAAALCSSVGVVVMQAI